MRSQVIVDIDEETAHAIRKHGDNLNSSSWERAACILGEEAGEVMKEVLDATRETEVPQSTEQIVAALTRIRDEAIDTASVAVRIIDRVDEKLCIIKAIPARYATMGE